MDLQTLDLEARRLEEQPELPGREVAVVPRAVPEDGIVAVDVRTDAVVVTAYVPRSMAVLGLVGVRAREVAATRSARPVRGR